MKIPKAELGHRVHAVPLHSHQYLDRQASACLGDSAAVVSLNAPALRPSHTVVLAYAIMYAGSGYIIEPVGTRAARCSFG